MNKSPKVSVVIPYYSAREGDLERAVRSVCNQTFQDFEILIVDDCSPLCAQAELNFLDDIRITIIKNKKNMNGAYSRNKGIKKAKGEYIALLDSDDFYLPDHLSNCIKNISDFDFVYSNIIYNLNGRMEYRETSDVNKYSIEKICNILMDSPPQTNSFFFKKSCFPIVQFDETLKRHQDYQFFVDFCRSGFSISKVNSFTTIYNIRSRKREIDIESVLYFWAQNKSFVDSSKFINFMVYIAIVSMRQKKNTYSNLAAISDLVNNKYFDKIISIRNEFLAYLFLHIYLYLVLEPGKIPKRIARVASSISFKIIKYHRFN